ncbi:MAG: tRNA lysidine(34) synthetase TilS [Oscillospiraceae bacterium]|nr:tRNA lysidine(34) synthetase TilS [Oscillospiraceae bacterium]
MMKDDLIRKYNMLPSGSRVLCAVSGGADSMCLLHWLFSLREEYGITLFAAHYEHGLRGEESLRDARFTEAQCAALGIPCRVGHGDVASFAAARKLGTEDAARTLRYRFLEETAEACGCDRIATAHTLDDNAETVLMNLCRGAGTRGLAGIPPVRGRLIRPLLATERSEITAYLTEHGIAHVEDSSNQTDDYTRNRIRHQVIPLLKEENPSFLRGVGRTAELLREDDDCLCREAEAFLREHCRDNAIPAKALLRLEPAVASRVLRSLCGSGVSMERTYALLNFAKGTERGVLEIPGQKIRREKGRLFFGVKD